MTGYNSKMYSLVDHFGKILKLDKFQWSVLDLSIIYQSHFEFHLRLQIFQQAYR